MTSVLATAVLVLAASLLGCSSDDDSGSSTSSSGTSGTSSSSGTTSTSSSSTSSSGGSECKASEDCPELTCTCGGFSGAKVQACKNGVCAKTCAEGGC